MVHLIFQNQPIKRKGQAGLHLWLGLHYRLCCTDKCVDFKLTLNTKSLRYINWQIKWWFQGEKMYEQVFCCEKCSVTCFTFLSWLWRFQVCISIVRGVALLHHATVKMTKGSLEYRDWVYEFSKSQFLWLHFYKCFNVSVAKKAAKTHFALWFSRDKFF